MQLKRMCPVEQYVWWGNSGVWTSKSGFYRVSRRRQPCKYRGLTLENIFQSLSWLDRGSYFVVFSVVGYPLTLDRCIMEGVR
jgi:hypothetical protein